MGRLMTGIRRRRFAAAVAGVAALATSVVIATGRAASGTDIITTAAGTGVAGFSGDTGQATAAQLNLPLGVVTDSAGNLFIADAVNNRVRKVDTAGVITTFAGTGVAGFSGDTGQATAAQLSSPVGVAVDGAGNVYIADLNNNRIRKVDTAGVITTFAGTGTAGFTGDTGQATAARINTAYGVAVDSAGNVYIADTGNNRVRKVDTAGVIDTIAGTGVAGFSGDTGQATAAQLNIPTGVAADGAGNVYIADYLNQRIRKVNTAGVITTIAGTGVAGFSGDTGQASLAQLNFPFGVHATSTGTLYIGDSNNNRVRKITNNPPTASFTANPTSGAAPLTVNFDASASTDPGGSIASYACTFGDGQSGSGATTNHIYTTGGSFTVTLTVTDNGGATASTTQTITVTGGGGGGGCTITGTPGANVLNGTPGPDVICGLGGADVINGRGGADILRGGNGPDVINGGNGPDIMQGGRGPDSLRGGRGVDVANGGPGADSCIAETRTSC